MKYLICLGMASLLVFCGCATSITVGSHTLKPNMNAATVTQYRNEAPNYEVLGVLQAKCEAVSVLGIYSGGVDGHAILWEEALKRYPQTTGIKDISQTNEFTNILWFIYTSVKTTYYGTAVREIPAK
jgi:hypothetical protein